MSALGAAALLLYVAAFLLVTLLVYESQRR
jgi:hypothetical protein